MKTLKTLVLEPEDFVIQEEYRVWQDRLRPEAYQAVEEADLVISDGCVLKDRPGVLLPARSCPPPKPSIPWPGEPKGRIPALELVQIRDRWIRKHWRQNSPEALVLHAFETGYFLGTGERTVE